MRNSFPSFGGVMLWDTSQAVGEHLCCLCLPYLDVLTLSQANNRFDAAIKNSMVEAGGTGFTFPACSEPEFQSGTSYTGGSRVSFGGYVFPSSVQSLAS